MFHSFIFTTIILTQVTGQQVDTYEYSMDSNAVSKCIEDYLLNFTDDPYYRENIGVTKVIVDLATKRFSGKTREKRDLFKNVYDFYDSVRCFKSDLFRDSQVHELLQWAIKDALVDCAESNQVPIFENEPRELAHILDHILVYWPAPLHIMIRTRNGRTALRRYAEGAQEVLDSALNYLGRDRNRFRVVIREMWMKRAKIYFGGRSTPFPYLRYRYTMTKGLRMYDKYLEYLHDEKGTKLEGS